RDEDSRHDRAEDARYTRDEDSRHDRGAGSRGDEAQFVVRRERDPEAPRYVAREEVEETADEPVQPKERVADDWFSEPKPVSRTIVIEREPATEGDRDELDYDDDSRARLTSEGRRTIVIGGHPDRLPVQRERTPRTTISRIGPKPDRIVAYAVAL